MTRLVLASGSPRRAQLLASIDLVFVVDAADIDETPRSEEHAVAYVERLAREKAHAVSHRRINELVIAADTTVALDGMILGKPIDDDDARSMLQRLSGRSHHVYTGMAVAFGDRVESSVCTTEVSMRFLTDADIAWYVSTGEPQDKAGAYAIQERAGAFVAEVRGNVQNVVGLPLTELDALMRRVGFDLHRFRVTQGN